MRGEEKKNEGMVRGKKGEMKGEEKSEGKGKKRGDEGKWEEKSEGKVYRLCGCDG